MINLFKTHYSIGKSVLTLEEGKDRSVFSVAKKLGLSEIIILDDNLSGAAEAYFQAEKEKIPVRIGCILRHSEDGENISNFNLIALNTQGYRDLVAISSFQETKKEKHLTTEEIKKYLTQNLWLSIPFYDSFLFKNLLEGTSCIFDIGLKPTLLLEDNDLPFDAILREKVLQLAEKEDLDTLDVQTCLYPDEDWFDAWQTVKTMHKRSYRGGTLSCPNLDNCGSTNFYPKIK